MSLILFILAVVGLTHIVVDSEMIAPVHKWVYSRSRLIARIMECYQCSGFWCGLMLGPILVSHNPLVWIACGCAGSFLAQLGWLVLDSLEAYTKDG